MIVNASFALTDRFLLCMRFVSLSVDFGEQAVYYSVFCF
jgi:hypothetical protein